MQQIYLLTSWDIAPCGVVTKDYGEGTLFPLSRQRPGGLKMVTIKNQLTTMTQTKLLLLLNKWMISGLGVKLSQHVNLFQSHFTDWYLQIFHDNPLRQMPQDLSDQLDNKSRLFWVMAWCLHARSHYLNLCWPRSQTLYIAWLGHNEFGPKADFRIVLGSLTGLLVDRIRLMTGNFLILYPWPPLPVFKTKFFTQLLRKFN